MCEWASWFICFVKSRFSSETGIIITFGCGVDSMRRIKIDWQPRLRRRRTIGDYVVLITSTHNTQMFTFANLQHFKLEFKWFACRAREMHCMADICMKVWRYGELWNTYLWMPHHYYYVVLIESVCIRMDRCRWCWCLCPVPVNVLTFRANIKIICCRNLEIYIKMCVVVHCMWNGMDVCMEPCALGCLGLHRNKINDFWRIF